MKITILLIAVLPCVVLSGCARDGVVKSAVAANVAPAGKVVPLPAKRAAAVESLQFFSAADMRKSLPLRDHKTLRKIALSQMPRGGISNFFGACKGRFATRGADNAYLAANLYALPADDPKTPRREYSLRLDLFSYSAKTAQLKRLQWLDLTKKLKCIYGSWGQGSDYAGAIDLLWIDAKRQKTPMLRMRMSGTVMSGVAGCYGLVIFSEGLRAQPVVQDFETYDHMMSGENLFFDARDKNGFLVLRQDLVNYDSDFVKQKTTTTLEKRTYFDWNGRAFVARKNKTPVTKPR